MQSADKLQQFQKGLYIATAVALLTVGAYAQVRGEAEARRKGGGGANKLPEYKEPEASIEEIMLSEQWPESI